MLGRCNGEPSYVSVDLSAKSFKLNHDELRERMSGNLCRCGAYNGIVDAIREAFVSDDHSSKEGEVAR